VRRAGQIFSLQAGRTVRNAGTLIDSIRPGIEVSVMRQPVDMVGHLSVELPERDPRLEDRYVRGTVEEVFGAVASVIEVDDYEHALHVANDSPYGLTAGIIMTSGPETCRELGATQLPLCTLAVE
jgi:hypothetical protein